MASKLDLAEAIRLNAHAQVCLTRAAAAMTEPWTGDNKANALVEAAHDAREQEATRAELRRQIADRAILIGEQRQRTKSTR
jgi:hypothetical protein